MTHWKTLASNSDTIAASDIEGHSPTVTIAGVEGGVFEGEDGKHDKKALITFVGKDKKLAANVINCTLIEAMFGAEVEDWAGHQITLMADKVEVAGKYKGQPCVRIKGSPELGTAQTVTIELPRRKPFQRQLVPTGKRPAPVDDIPFGDDE
mgnify:FL=1